MISQSNVGKRKFLSKYFNFSALFRFRMNSHICKINFNDYYLYLFSEFLGGNAQIIGLVSGRK